MIYCVDIHLVFTNPTRRSDVYTAIGSRISGKTRWGNDRYLSITSKNGLPKISATFRFLDKADQEDLYNYLLSFATGPRIPAAGSTLTMHTCYHDGEGVCTIELQETW